MRTMREAKRESGPSEATTRPCVSVRNTTETFTRSRARVGSGVRRISGLLSEGATSEPEESTWGWVRRHKFDPRWGVIETDED